MIFSIFLRVAPPTPHCRYCESPGLAAVTGDCAAQYYCTARAEFAQPDDGTTGNICPAGKYCTGVSSSHYYCSSSKLLVVKRENYRQNIAENLRIVLVYIT